MKKFVFFLMPVLIIASVFLVGCEEDPEDSLFDPAYVSGEQPIITNVEPDSVFAGIGELTITGENFIPDTKMNWVYFNGTPGIITEATTTKLTVTAPSLVSNAIKLKVGVHGSDLFSEQVDYTLMAAVESVFGFKTAEVPLKIACANDGNIYFTMDNSGRLDDSVQVVNYLTGEKKGFGIAEKEYNAMKMGPNNELYALHGTGKRIYKYAETGGEPEVWADRKILTEKIYDFDFGPEQNIWGAGKGDGVVRLKLSDKSQLIFDFEGEVTAVRVFDGYLYLATIRDGGTSSDPTDDTHKIYRRQIISADEMGDEEEFFDLAQVFDMASVGDDQVMGMTFSQDGTLYLSLQDDPDAPKSPAIIVVAPGGGAFESMYPVLFDETRTNYSIAWGVNGGTNIFVSRSETRDAGGEIVDPAVLLRVNTLKTGAPEYGRGDL